MRENSAGNVLFIILISIALFAALSYTVVQSGRTNVDIMTQQQARIYATEIFQYTSSIEKAVSRLMTMKGCKDTEISFGIASTSTCGVFSKYGGKVPFMPVDPNWLDKNEEGGVGYGSWAMINYIGDPNSPHKVINLGSDDAETMAHLNYLKLEVCNELNKLSENGFNSPPPEAQGPTKGSTGDTRVYGKPYGCTGPQYQYYHVIIIR